MSPAVGSKRAVALHHVGLCCCAVAGSLSQISRAYSVVPPPRDSQEKEMLHRMLRVDHAGEYGANRIYAGQMAVLGRSSTGPLIQVWPQHICLISRHFFELILKEQVFLLCLGLFINVPFAFVRIAQCRVPVYSLGNVGSGKETSGEIQWNSGREQSSTHSTLTFLEHHRLSIRLVQPTNEAYCRLIWS